MIESRNNLSKAWLDFISSFSYWRIFCLFGVNDIRKRYSRSSLGQLWITLSLAIQIASIGLVWGYIFKIPLSDYLPYLATGMVFWNYVTITLTEGSGIFITFASYIKELSIPKLSYVNSLIVKNIIILLHNAVVLIPIYFCYSVDVSFYSIFLSLLGLLLMSIFSYLVIIPISLVSLRFRDITNIINSIIPIALYVTPIMWKIDILPEKYHSYMVLNPITVFLSLCRDPLLGIQIDNNYYIAAILYIGIFTLFSTLLFSKFRSKIVYWV